MTPLDRIEAAEKAASPAGEPWTLNTALGDIVEDSAGAWVADFRSTYDATLIALLRNHAVDLIAVARAAQALSHFLEHEKETFEPPEELLDRGYAALETSADYNREEELGITLLAALALLTEDSE